MTEPESAPPDETEPMTLAEKCRLVAYYGDISAANRDRWFKFKGTHPGAALLRDYDYVGRLNDEDRALVEDETWQPPMK